MAILNPVKLTIKMDHHSSIPWLLDTKTSHLSHSLQFFVPVGSRLSHNVLSTTSKDSTIFNSSKSVFKAPMTSEAQGSILAVRSYKIIIKSLYFKCTVALPFRKRVTGAQGTMVPKVRAKPIRENIKSRSSTPSTWSSWQDLDFKVLGTRLWHLQFVLPLWGGPGPYMRLSSEVIPWFLHLQHPGISTVS